MTGYLGGAGYGMGVGGNCCCNFPTLVILILIVLQFSRYGDGYGDGDGDGGYDGRHFPVGNGVLFIIALFFLSCCNPCRTAY